MRIVKVVKKDDKNVTVFFDNDDKLFLSYETFLKNGLKKNDEISESCFSFLIEENQSYYLKQKAFRYLGRRLHSEYELKLKLRQKGANGNIIDKIINELKTSGYINDYEFASTFADEHIKNKFMGKKKIESELFKRGIARDIILKVIEKKFSQGNDFDNALELGVKKLKSLSSRKIEKQKIKSKLYSFLLSKGYDFDTGKRVIENLLGEE